VSNYLQKNGDAVQRPARAFLPALLIQIVRGRRRVWVQRNDGVHARSHLVERCDAIQVERHQLRRRQLSRRHRTLQFADALLERVEARRVQHAPHRRSDDERRAGRLEECASRLVHRTASIPRQRDACISGWRDWPWVRRHVGSRVSNADHDRVTVDVGDQDESGKPLP
jgi:hypothetical protein